MEEVKTTVILITDDNQEDRLRMRRYLESAGYSILEAAGSKDTLSIVEDQEIRLDLLITDIRMPHLNGCELAKRVGAIRPELKVLFVSGFTLEILTLFKLGIDKTKLVNKSVDKNTFLATVRGFLTVPVPDSRRSVF